jgi:hypothetical protein
MGVTLLNMTGFLAFSKPGALVIISGTGVLVSP